MSTVGATGYTTNLKAYDYIIDKDGSTYIAIDQNGITKHDNSDFGALFNAVLADITHQGIIGIRGGNTYVPTTQPLVQGSGSPLEKQIEVVGVGGGVWPIIDAPSGIHCFQIQGGANIYLHKLHLQPHTSGGGSGIYGPESVGVAYDENCLWKGRFADLKIEGGTSGTYLVDLALPESYVFEDRIYIDGASGVHGMIIRNTATGQYPYGEGQNVAAMTISTNGADTTCLEFAGAASGHEVMHVDWHPHMLLINDTGSAGTIALKASYLESSFISGIHFENVEYGIQQNTGTWNTIFDGGMSFSQINANTGAFFDMNNAGNCTIQNFVCWFGGANRPIIDDENDSATAPHKYENLVYYGTGGSPVDDLGLNAQLETYASGKYYRQRGTAGVWP